MAQKEGWPQEKGVLIRMCSRAKLADRKRGRGRNGGVSTRVNTSPLPGGWLVTGHAEGPVSCVRGQQMEAVVMFSVGVYHVFPPECSGFNSVV